MSILQLSRTERATTPVFIVGEARSGTTILYRTLQKHPSFRPRSENLWESKVMRYADEVSALRPGEPASLVGYMADEQRYTDFLRSIAPLRPLLRAGDVLQRRVRSAGHADHIWAATGHPLLVRSYFHHARHGRGVTRVLEKTPRHVHHVDRLLRCYPRARLIYIHRHPVDVYTSYVRRAQVDPNARWARMPVPRFAEQWATNTRLALDAAARLPDSFLLLRYEDFTADPDTVGQRLCAFLEEPYEPEMVIERNPDLTRRKAAPHLYGQITTKTKQWQDYLTDAKATRLQELVAPEMERLAYEPYSI